MSKNYSKADLQNIAEGLVEVLRECDDGTELTTWKLFESVNYEMDEFDPEDLAVIHRALMKAARANWITLEMPADGNTAEKEPYHLAYIVRNSKAQIKCPRCGSRNTARYIYGYPLFDEKMQKNLEEGKWELGGCCLRRVEVNGRMVDMMPSRKCNECGKDFGTPPILITPKKGTAEDYREIVTSIEFSEGAYRSILGDKRIKLVKNENGALLHIEKDALYPKFLEDKQITQRKWNRILDMLYCEMYLHEWKKRYEDRCVIDGKYWELNIKMTGNRRRHYYGSNDFPPYWKELLKALR